MIVDANLLLYARDEASAHHAAAARWLTRALNGPRLVGLPWLSLGAFLRISTHPRIFARPLGARDARAQIEEWLAAEVAWIPEPGPRYAALLGDMIVAHDVTGNLMPDAMLAALAAEHGLTVCSTDTDFARFSEVSWRNPIAD